MKSGHSIERMELVDSVLLLQGWAVGQDAAPTTLILIGHSASGEPWQLPIPFNRERPDVCAALDIPDTSLQCGFFFYGRIPEGHPSALLRDDSPNGVALHTWAESATGKSGEYRQRLVSWAYLLRKAWGLVRAGQWRNLCERARRHLRSAFASRKPNLAGAPQPDIDCLFIDHDMGGGANQYRQASIRQRIKQGEHVALLTFSVVGLRYMAYLALPDGSSQPMKQMAWAEVLPWIDSLRPKQIFYNNAVSFPHALALAEGLAAYKAEHRQSCRLTLAVHDYFVACPSQHLMNAEGRYCNLPEESICANCLPRSQQAMVSLYRHHGLQAWRQAWGTLLQAADEVLAFDPSARQLLARAFRPINDQRWFLRPHGVAPLNAAEQEQLLRWRQRKNRKSGRIGVVGLIGSDVKGVQEVHQLVSMIVQQKLPYEVVAIGQVSPRPQHSEQYRETGPYKPEDLVRLVVDSDIDAFFFSSIGPETYSYVLHEIERFSLPIAAFNIGAQSTFLLHYPSAIILEMGDSALDILKKLKPYLQG